MLTLLDEHTDVNFSTFFNYLKNQIQHTSLMNMFIKSPFTCII